MLFAFFSSRKTRRDRPTIARRAARSRPLVEEMEGRQLLSTVPYVLINSPKVVEGTGGTTTMKFTVSLSGPTTVPVSVNFQTAGATATSGADFTATGGTLTFSPGQTSKTIPVSIVPDSIVERTEAFTMKLSNARNAVFASSTGVGQILDDDATVAPKLSIADMSMKRGLSGTKTMYFPVTLNTALTYPVSVTARTSNVSAIAGVDYQANSKVLTFAAGVKTMYFPVTIYGTSKPVASKVFYVNLSGANVPISDATAAGVISYGA